MNWFLFKTAWGWAAIAYQNEGLLCKFILPLPSRSELLSRIKGETRILAVKADSQALDLSERIQAYFSGSIIQDWDVRLDLSGFTPFTRRVLEKTGEIGYGQTCFYSGLARALNKPGASRAVGQALARNCWPLIVPCHRVVGVQSLGGFSAFGGIQVKQKLLEWEKAQLIKQSTVWDVFYNTLPQKDR